jgi:hypothetical protein
LTSECLKPNELESGDLRQGVAAGCGSFWTQDPMESIITTISGTEISCGVGTLSTPNIEVIVMLLLNLQLSIQFHQIKAPMCKNRL